MLLTTFHLVLLILLIVIGYDSTMVFVDIGEIITTSLSFSSPLSKGTYCHDDDDDDDEEKEPF